MALNASARYVSLSCVYVLSLLIKKHTPNVRTHILRTFYTQADFIGYTSMRVRVCVEVAGGGGAWARPGGGPGLLSFMITPKAWLRNWFEAPNS